MTDEKDDDDVKHPSPVIMDYGDLLRGPRKPVVLPENWPISIEPTTVVAPDLPKDDGPAPTLDSIDRAVAGLPANPLALPGKALTVATRDGQKYAVDRTHHTVHRPEIPSDLQAGIRRYFQGQFGVDQEWHLEGLNVTRSMGERTTAELRLIGVGSGAVMTEQVPTIAPKREALEEVLVRELCPALFEFFRDRFKLNMDWGLREAEWRTLPRTSHHTDMELELTLIGRVSVADVEVQARHGRGRGTQPVGTTDQMRDLQRLQELQTRVEGLELRLAHEKDVGKQLRAKLDSVVKSDEELLADRLHAKVRLQYGMPQRDVLIAFLEWLAGADTKVVAVDSLGAIAAKTALTVAQLSAPGIVDRFLSPSQTPEDGGSLVSDKSDEGEADE